jgi:Arc/MetJ-type ribon-helix-helix transcriptional regulator
LAKVQLRLSRRTLEITDRWVDDGKFKSRSDAMKPVIRFYEEREETRELLKMLMKHSQEARENPKELRVVVKNIR